MSLSVLSSSGDTECLQSCKSLVSTEDQEYLNVELPPPDGESSSCSSSVLNIGAFNLVGVNC